MKVDNILAMVYKDDQVKLESQKIELGIVQDMLKVYKNGVDTFTSGKSMIDKSKESFEDALSKYNKIESQTKELGLPMTKEIENIGERVKSFLKEANKIK